MPLRQLRLYSFAPTRKQRHQLTRARNRRLPICSVKRCSHRRWLRIRLPGNFRRRFPFEQQSNKLLFSRRQRGRKRSRIEWVGRAGDIRIVVPLLPEQRAYEGSNSGPYRQRRNDRGIVCEVCHLNSGNKANGNCYEHRTGEHVALSPTKGAGTAKQRDRSQYEIDQRN